MKKILFLFFILNVFFYSCGQRTDRSTVVSKSENEVFSKIEHINDKEDIQNLIKEVLKWSQSENSIDILPVIADSKDSIYIAFDLDKHKRNLDKLKETNYFAIEFINNYNQIILTFDRKLQNGEFEPWLVGDLPTFGFINGADPWCLCQDVPFDEPIPWDYLEIEIIDLDSIKGELTWKWGNLGQRSDHSWADFEYRFNVIKENNKWKISYLQGFDNVIHYPNTDSH